MFRVSELKVVRVATTDADAATATFQANFGLSVTRASRDDDVRTVSTFLAIGAAEIEMEAPTAPGSPLAAFLAERGAGLHELVLEVDDLERARASLSSAGVEVVVREGPDGRRAGSIDPTRAHGVRITLVAR